MVKRTWKKKRTVGIYPSTLYRCTRGKEKAYLTIANDGEVVGMDAALKKEFGITREIRFSSGIDGKWALSVLRRKKWKITLVKDELDWDVLSRLDLNPRE